MMRQGARKSIECPYEREVVLRGPANCYINLNMIWFCSERVVVRDLDFGWFSAFEDA
jgi:hypothetical protein